MFGFLKSKIKNREHYVARYAALSRELVPLMNQASTVQGEILRCIGNLHDESARNGNMNWDRANEEEVEFLLETLPDDHLFSEQTCAEILSDLKLIARAGRSGHGKGSEPFFQAEAEVFDRIMFRVVDWCDAKSDLVEVNPIDPDIRRFEK